MADEAPATPDRIFRDLEEALGIVVFFATGLERALCDTHWKLESEQLAHAARRSAAAAALLKERLPELLRYQKKPRAEATGNVPAPGQ